MDDNLNKLSHGKVAGSYNQGHYLDDVKPKNRPDLYIMLNKKLEEKKKDIWHSQPHFITFSYHLSLISDVFELVWSRIIKPVWKKSDNRVSHKVRKKNKL